MGYWVDLSTLKFDDSNAATWIQMMPLGSYEHPVYGKVDITPERAQQFAANVKSRVRGQDLDIDYDHKEKTTEAAGWLKDAEARSDGLWGLVEWTKDAAQKIASKAYRYFSPEFVDEWTHPKTNEVHKDVLFGGALTNRPFLKDILPINMSEVFSADRQQSTEGGARMEIDDKVAKELATLVGLPEGSNIDHVVGALRTLRAQADNNSGQPPQAAGTPTPQAPAQPVAASEGLSEEVVQLAEKSPAVKALLDRVQAQDKSLAEVQVALRMSEVDRQVASLSEGNTVLTAAAKEEAKKLLLGTPKEFSESVLGLLKQVVEGKATVELGERGHIGGAAAIKDDAQKFSEVVDGIVKNDNLEYADAVSRASAMHPELFEAYRSQSYSFREN
jgi:hypothetical protein